MHFNFEFTSLFRKLNCGFWVHVFFRGGGHKRVVWMLWCVTPCLHCTELKCIECMQNAVWHSYQSLSMEMNVPTDSRIRVHSVVQRPAEPGSPSFLPLSAQTCIKLPHTINTKFTLFVFAFKQISLKRQITFSQKKRFSRIQFIFHDLQQILPSPCNGKRSNTKRLSIEMEMRIWYCKLQTASVCGRYACALVCASYFFKCLALMA